MTNGEKLCVDFPNMRYTISEHRVITTIGIAASFDLDWWNAEYEEPTTKNDCETCIHNKGVLECDMYGCKYEPTTKNDSPHCQHTDEEIAKSFIEDVEAVKDILPTTKNCESCRYYGSHYEACNYCYKCSLWTEQEPNTWSLDDAAEEDNKRIMPWYLEPFKQVIGTLKQEPTAKNDLPSELEKNSKKLEKDFGESDCISRADALRVAKNEYLRGWHNALCKALSEKYSIHCEEGNFSVIQEETITGLGLSMNCALGKDVESFMSIMPSVTPQEPRWIPVSEKLPDIHNYSDSYLVTLKRGGVHIAKFTECNGENHWWTYDDVVAWMPLPKPYEPQESEEIK